MRQNLSVATKEYWKFFGRDGPRSRGVLLPTDLAIGFVSPFRLLFSTAESG
jgi:hypothetical protein